MSIRRDRRISRAALILLSAGVFICLFADRRADAQQILEVEGSTLTAFKPTASSGVQGVRPRFDQRGVHLDGSSRTSTMFGLAMAGNTLDRSSGPARLGEIDLVTGTYSPTDIDLVLPSVGIPWAVGRSYNARQFNSGGSRFDSNGYQGRNWFQLSQPEILLHDDDSNPATKGAADVLYIVFGADRYIELKRTASNSDTFKAKNGAAGVATFNSGDDTFQYVDQLGNSAVFHGNDTASGAAAYQLWKLSDAAGNIAFVGDVTTKATAVSAGYDGSGRILKAYDASGRRYTYTYSTIDSVSRLTQVKAETKTSGTWASPSGVAEVGRVDYAYYQTGDTTWGDSGNLKLVTLTTPLSDPSQSLTRRKYYRYYTGSFHSTTNPGAPYGIKMVVGFEGTRTYDWLDTNLTNESFNGGGVSDATLKAYADSYFEHDSSNLIVSAFFNGECGCSGGANGTYALTYTQLGSGGYGTYVGNTSYDTGWATRIIINQPDTGWTTKYVDETGQLIHSILTDADPATAFTVDISTVWERNSNGVVSSVLYPDNINYNHSTVSFVQISGAGQVASPVLTSSGNVTSFSTTQKVKEGSSGSLVTVTDRTLSDRSLVVGATNVIRPIVTASSVYPDGTTAEQTTYTYAYHSGTNTNPLYLALKQITTTNPTVSTGKNGSNSPTASDVYLNSDGRTAFTKSATSMLNYSEYDSYGLLSKSIRDPKSGTSETAMNTAANSSNFNITLPSGGLHYVSTYTYDPQGRMSTATAPDGLMSATWHTKLSDERLVTISIPRFTTGGSTTYYGPCSYTVSNHAGKTEFSGTIAVSSSGTTTALTSWINSTVADPITALSGSAGALKRMATSLYTVTGHQQNESRSYFLIPGSGAGTSGTNYDATFYKYDDMGRTLREVAPTGTLTRSVFDFAGRTIELWIGTNDNSFAGGSVSGTDNMTKLAMLEYDAMSRVIRTKQDPDGNWGTTGDQRITETTYDYRGNAVIVKRPQSPHTLTKFDNLKRPVATGLYSNATNLTVTTDPTSNATISGGGTRLGLSETVYDERGRVSKTAEWEINQSTGAKGSSINSLTWFDADGRTIKSRGEQISKTFYDTMGRPTHQFVLASTDDSVYADAATVSGDVVLQESQTVYDNADNTGLVMMQASISRHHNDIGGSQSTGALDTNADADPYKLTAGNLKGRAQITATWYDAWRRPVDTVAFGTYGGSNFERRPSGSWLSVPARSDTELRTTTTYNTDGTVQQVTDPRGIVSGKEYDDAGRVTKQIANYVDGSPGGGTLDDQDRTIKFEYTNGLRTKYIADLTGTGNDQETIYTYGTVKGTIGSGSPIESAIATGHLLHNTQYPDSAGGSDVITSAYNALGETVWTREQDGNIVEMEFDTAGRITHSKITTLGSGLDGSVRRVSLTFDSRSLVDTVTQYSNSTPGSGAALDQVQYTYDGWGQVTGFEQDVDSAIGASGRASFTVSHAYSAVTSGNGRYTLKKTSDTLPGSFTVTYDYSSSGGSHAADVSRVSGLSYSSGSRVLYDYLGVGQTVRTVLQEPDCTNALTDNPTWTSVPTYGNLDRFNRTTSSRWTNTSAMDYHRVDLAYDRNSNITSADDTILTAGTNSIPGWDAKYSMDDLNRLIQAEEGTLSSGSISSRSRDEWWKQSGGSAGLSPTGTWLNHRLDLDGNGVFGGTNELDETSTFNKANEQLTRQPTTSVSPVYTQTHDAAGRQTDDGRDYTYKFDGFGRLKEVRNRSNSALVAEYSYNGLNFRTGWHYDVTRSGGGAPDGTVDGNDPWYWFVYNERWQTVGTFRGSDANPKERFIHHGAGLSGAGDSSYIDAVVCLDRDLTNGWAGAADGTLETRFYINQNWRGDVAVVTDDVGVIQERTKYSAYGVPTCLASADYDGNGTVNSTDDTKFQADLTALDPLSDFNFDGATDFFDYLDFTAAYSTQLGENNGRGVLSRSAVGNRFGYAGYQWDPAIAGAAVIGGKWHVRHRVLDAERGNWFTRDPIEYGDGSNLFAYCSNKPIRYADPSGLAPESCHEWRLRSTGSVSSELPLANPIFHVFLNVKWELVAAFQLCKCNERDSSLDAEVRGKLMVEIGLRVGWRQTITGSIGLFEYVEVGELNGEVGASVAFPVNQRLTLYNCGTPGNSTFCVQVQPRVFGRINVGITIYKTSRKSMMRSEFFRWGGWAEVWAGVDIKFCFRCTENGCSYDRMSASPALWGASTELCIPVIGCRRYTW